MLTLPAELLPLIVEFAPLFSKPVWEHAKVLLVGAILAHWQTHGDGVLAGHGIEPGEVFRQLSPGLESGALVAPGCESHLAAVVGHVLCPRRGVGLWIG